MAKQKRIANNGIAVSECIQKSELKYRCRWKILIGWNSLAEKIIILIIFLYDSAMRWNER